jgi:head-tail adaptor
MANKNPQLVKDKKVQFYLPQHNIEADKPYRKFPYTATVYAEGGLWAHVRSHSFKERFSAGYGVELTVKQCTINNNTEINNHYKAIYNGTVYDVSLPDTYEDYVEDIKFILTETADNQEYSTDDDVFEAELEAEV